MEPFWWGLLAGFIGAYLFSLVAGLVVAWRLRVWEG